MLGSRFGNDPRDFKCAIFGVKLPMDKILNEKRMKVKPCYEFIHQVVQEESENETLPGVITWERSGIMRRGEGGGRVSRGIAPSKTSLV